MEDVIIIPQPVGETKFIGSKCSVLFVNYCFMRFFPFADTNKVDLVMNLSVMEFQVGEYKQCFVKCTEFVPLIFANKHYNRDMMHSPVQNTMLRVHSRISEAYMDKSCAAPARLLVPAQHIGCLLGICSCWAPGTVFSTF